MAIYIDIYARLNQGQLVKEGEQLRRYINGLEDEIRERGERGARGATRKLIKLEDEVINKRDQSANKADELTRAIRRLEWAEAGLAETRTRVTRTDEERKQLDEDIIRLTKARAVAEQDLVYKLQAAGRATRDHTLAEKDLNDETKARTKNLREVTRITNINRRELTRLSRTTNQLRRDTENLHSSNITFVQDNKGIAKSMEGLAAATEKTSRAREKYNEIRKKDGVKASEIKAQGRVLKDALQAEASKARDVQELLVSIIGQRRAHDSVVQSNEHSLRRLANESLQLEKRTDDLRSVNRDVIDQNITLTKQFDRVGDSIKKVSEEFRKYHEMSQDSSVSSDALENQIGKINEAFVNQQRVARDSSAAIDDYAKRQVEAEKRIQEAQRRQRDRDWKRLKPGSIGQYFARNIGALTPLGTLSPTTLLPLAGVLGSVGEAAVTASQSIALLPAAGTAAVAGIATLTVGMWGFGDALQGMSDPKKFAEALYTLSPNAQQAALSIKNLVDGPLGDLKRATQDALFANVSPALQQLAQTLGPTIQRMTTSIAGSFNKMFTGMSFQFMTPEMQQRVSVISDNVASMFDRVRPGLMAFTDAFMKIAETGSGFLPQLADGFSRLMITFDNFITKAQEDGSLQNFMKKGIDAVAALSKWLLSFGQEIYEVFGNKSPEEFITILNGVKDIIIGVGKVFVWVAEKIEAWGPAIGAVVDALGGVENIIGFLIGGAVAGWMVKFVKFWKDVKGLAGPFVASLAAKFGLIGPAAQAAAGTTVAAFGSAGTKAGTGFASAFKARIGAFGWVGIGIGIATAIEEGIRSFKSSDNSESTNRTLDAIADGFDPGKVLNPSWLLEKFLGPPPGAVTPPSPDAPVQGPGLNGDFPPPTQPEIPAIFGPTFQGPDVPLDENGKALTDSERLNRRRGLLPRESYAVDPFTDPITGQKLTPMLPIGPNGMPEYPAGGVPGTPSIQGPVMPQYNSFGQLTGYGANMVDPEEVFDAQLAVRDKAIDLEEAKKDLLAAQMEGILSAEEVNDLERKVVDQKLGLHKALVQLGKAQTGDVEKLKNSTKDAADSLGDFGAQIDKDFGISKGLSGIAENLTKFLANLAFAPVFGAIRGAQAGLGFPNGEGVGSGLMGMAASSMGYYKGGPLDPDVQEQNRVQAQTQTQTGYTPTYRTSSSSSATSGAPLAAEAGYSPSLPALRLNPNNVSTAGLKPQSMALLGLIQGMTQFAKVPLTSAKLGREGDPYPWHPSGTGLDFGLDASIPEQSALGDQLKTFLEANKQMFGVNHVLWKTMQGGNHFNHLHVGLNGSGNGRPDTSPLLQALGNKVPLALNGVNSTLASLSSGIPIPLPVTIVGGAAGVGAVTPPPGAPGGASPAAGANSPVPVPGAGKPGGPPGSTGSMKDEAVTKVWTVQPDGSIVWRSSYGNPTAPPKGQPGAPATTPPTPPLQKFAKGGEVPIIAHSGEHVLTRDDVSAMGGQAAVYNFRRSLHRYEQGGPIQPTNLGDLLGASSPPPAPPAPPPPPAVQPPKPIAAPTPDPEMQSLFGYGEPAAVPAVPESVQPAQAAQLPNTVLPGGVETPGTVIGAQVEAPAGYGEGFSMTGGGLLGMAQSAAVSAAALGGAGGGGGPAAAAALQMAMELMNRGIEYAGQVAAIGAQGVMETFLPAGGSELAQNNWATRWLGGIAGAAPAVANLAGGTGASNQSMLAGVGGPLTPEQIAAQGMDPNRTQHTGAGAPPGPYTGVNIQNYVVQASEDRAGQDLARYQPAPGAR